MKTKFLTHLGLGAALIVASTGLAQTPARPDNISAQAAQKKDAAAEISASPSPSIPVEPPSLIPPNILPGPDAASLPQEPAAPDLQLLNTFFKQSSLGKTADEHRLHVQMSALETRIRNDEDLHALKAAAQHAPTDLEKRHRLKAYYESYYKKLRALADTPDLKAYLDTQRAGDELLLLQPRVRHETDEAQASALALARVGLPAAGAAPAPSQAPVNDILRSDDNALRP